MFGQISGCFAAVDRGQEIVAGFKLKTLVFEKLSEDIENLILLKAVCLQNPCGFNEDNRRNPNALSGPFAFSQFASNHFELLRIIFGQMTDQKVGVPGFHSVEPKYSRAA